MPTVRHPSGAGTSAPPRVKGYTDQNGQKWLRVSHRGRRGFVRLDSLTAARSDWPAELVRQGVVIITRSTCNLIAHQVEGLNDYDASLVVFDHTGWTDGHFLWPGEPVPARIRGQLAFDARPVTDASSLPMGCYADWESGVRHLVSGQALPTFALCCAFAGLLLPHVRNILDNPGFEICGPSSLGKSTLLRLLASVLGAGGEWVRDWNTTANGLEAAMACCGGVLLLDEVGLFVASHDPGRAREYRQTIMRLAAGTAKARYGTVTPALQRFVFLSSTNASVETLLAGLPAAELEATRVRLVTVQADAGSGLGVFDHLPRGVTDAKGAVDLLGALVARDHGWAGRKFVSCLERGLGSSSGRQRLLAQVERQMATFRRRAGGESGLSGTEVRVLDHFALVAAAGALARGWGCLPVDGVHRAVLALYGRREQVAVPPPQSARDRVAAYVRRHRAAFYDLREGVYPLLDRAALDAAPGFLKRHGGATWLLVAPARWRAEFGAAAGRLLQELEREGLLWVREHRQTQERVRASHPKDRVYRIRIAVEILN